MPRGHLVIRVKEASGKNKSESVVWDPNFIEGFVRAELRTTEGRKTSVQSTPKRVLANQITWDEELRLEIQDNSKELRLMLCREKRTGTRVGTSVIAACGIFVTDIMEAVPIDKYFELFKPGAAGEGGFIRIGIDFEDHSRKRGQANGAPSPASTERPHEFYTQLSLDADDPTSRGTTVRRPTPRPPASTAAVCESSTESSNLPSYIDAVKRPPQTHATNVATSAGNSPKSRKSKGGGVLKAGLLLAAIGAAVFFAQQKKTEIKAEEEKGKAKDFFKRK